MAQPFYCFSAIFGRFQPFLTIPENGRKIILKYKNFVFELVLP